MSKVSGMQKSSVVAKIYDAQAQWEAREQELSVLNQLRSDRGYLNPHGCTLDYLNYSIHVFIATSFKLNDKCTRFEMKRRR
jgi:hypothetical protein